MLDRKGRRKYFRSARDFMRLQRGDRQRLRPPFLTPFFLALLFPLTASLSERPATNAVTLRAGIFIFAPERGLRPSRARRARTTKLPKGVSATRSPFCNAPVISLNINSMICDAARFEIWACEATESTRSAFVNESLLRRRWDWGYTEIGGRLPIGTPKQRRRAAPNCTTRHQNPRCSLRRRARSRWCAGTPRAPRYCLNALR